MPSAPTFDFFSIGHSNIPAERFVALLEAARIKAVADVRSVPASRHFPWFSKKNLQARLEGAGIAYLPMGDALGGRPRDKNLFRAGVADYEAMAAQPSYRAGIAALLDATKSARVCIMCAEREPLDCHRCLLVARSLAERCLTIGHILHDGSIESHAAVEQQLLALAEKDDDLFAGTKPREKLAAAYRHRARAVAFRAPPAKRATAVGPA